MSPLPASVHASLAPLLPLLAEHLLSLAPFAADPLLLRSVLGPAALVDPFMKNWPAMVAAPREGDYIANQHLRPMTLTSAELASLVPLPDGHSVSRVTEADLSPEDLTSLCDSLHKFRNWGESPSTPSDRSRLLPELLTMLQEHAVFIYRIAGGSIAAFVDVARPTTRTVAIRGVYTRGEHRGQGIAERAVREVGRAYLASRVLVYDFKSRAPEYEEKETKWGGRGEVTLFVAEENPGTVKAYRRAGYVMGEEVWADRSLEGVEPGEW